MLKSSSLIQKSLLHHWRSNVAIALGVAAATAVLTGALIVGDSMRGSLHDLTLQRLGKIDEILVSEGFFRQALAAETAELERLQDESATVQPAILFPGGTVEWTADDSDSGPVSRAGNVTVLGITDEFWKLDGGALNDLKFLNEMSLGGQEVIINQSLAEELGIAKPGQATETAYVTLRIPKRNQLPSDSSLGKKDDLIESLVRLKVVAVVPTEGLGRFGLHPSQADPLTIYVPIELLQNALSRTVLKHKDSPEQANVLLIARDGDDIPSTESTEQLRDSIQPTLEDLGLSLKRVTQTFGDKPNEKKIFDYWSLSSERLVLSDEQATAIQKAFPDAKPVFTYLANDIRKLDAAEATAESDDESGIPFSMVSAIDFDSQFAPVDVESGKPVASPQDDQIVLTQWASKDLDAEVGDSIQLTFFEPESADGEQIDRTANFTVASIVKLVEPSKPMRVRRGRPPQPAEYDSEPAVTNDPDLTPEVPGLTDAASIDNWDLPFATADKIRSQDDQYWIDYRTTPKAYVSLATGQKLWDSRFGMVTSFRIPDQTGSESPDSGGEARLQVGGDLLSAVCRAGNPRTAQPLAGVGRTKRSAVPAPSNQSPDNYRAITFSQMTIAGASSLTLLDPAYMLQPTEVPSKGKLDDDLIRSALLSQFKTNNVRSGMELVDIKRRGLAASSGSTPFDVLFLALSMFVIGSALILVSLLFRLGLQQRASELGLMSAVGLSDRQVGRICLWEMAWVSLLGAWIGIQLGVGYAALMIYGLSTWWVGAISRPFLKLHIGWPSLAIGLLAGTLIGSFTILWTLRSIRKRTVTQLLSNELESTSERSQKADGRSWLVVALTIMAVGLSVTALSLAGEAQAGAFMGSGFFILSALLVWLFQRLRRAVDRRLLASTSDLVRRAAARNPLRSTLTAGMVAVASFLIVAVSAFRLAPSEQGTAGFDWVARSSQPIVDPVSMEKIDGRNSSAEVFSFRYKSGEDASCNNLYQSTQPQVLGVSDAFVRSFDQQQGRAVPRFAMGGTVAETDAEQANPWRLLNRQVHAGTGDDPIPVLIDKNTANYSLKIYFPGTDFQVDYDSGETVHFRAVGFLANTILQGCLITSENNFLKAFPATSGYQYFLIRDNEATSVASKLESDFGDYGFDARSATAVLADFMSVQNTYLSTFQTLGGLGLLLGTFGLAAVLIRSVLERKRELGLMRAIGFQSSQLQKMVLAENAWLLVAGLGIGVAAALFATVPHWLIGTASVPWLELAFLFAAILVVGLLTGSLASRTVARMPLLESLRE